METSSEQTTADKSTKVLASDKVDHQTQADEEIDREQIAKSPINGELDSNDKSDHSKIINDVDEEVLVTNSSDNNNQSIPTKETCPQISHANNQSNGLVDVGVGVGEGGDVDVDVDVEDDDGDPIPSGTGSVSKDCSPIELIGWSELLPKWHTKLQQRPKGLEQLVRSNGIPEPLRGEVWQLLSGAHESLDLMDKYRIYLTKEAPCEQIILRDVHRTYPAHENFRSDSQSSLADSLFKVCKAYAVYDEEIGYCQGLSFLVAALLLHMPEEQAFCVFTRIMQQYKLRDLFRNNFDELYLKFYQLEYLLEEHMPDLYEHFNRIGIEPFTYASQWFLTIFTAKFPLNAVFNIMDIFLLDGINTIFQIALALLKASKFELLALDFEGVLRYFRVHMPKRYRNQENVKLLIQSSAQISLKRLKKLAKNYEQKQQKEKLKQKQTNPLTYIQLRAQLESLEDKFENLAKENQNYLHQISDMEDEKARLEVEVSQLKEVFRRELNRAETELARDGIIVSDYKKICSQLSRRLDDQNNSIDKFVTTINDLLNDNEQCQNKSCYNLIQEKIHHLYNQLKNQSANEQQQVDNNKQRKQQQQQQQTSPLRLQMFDLSERAIGAYVKDSSTITSSEAKIQHLTKHVDDLEIELARTKLALVEAECRCQQLTHDLSVGATVELSSAGQPGGGSVLAGKLDFVKAAVTASRPASVAFAKINNLISEKISTPSIVNTATTTTAANVTTAVLDKC